MNTIFYCLLGACLFMHVLFGLFSYYCPADLPGYFNFRNKLVRRLSRLMITLLSPVLLAVAVMSVMPTDNLLVFAALCLVSWAVIMLFLWGVSAITCLMMMLLGIIYTKIRDYLIWTFKE